MAEEFRHEARGRNRRTALALAGAWAAMAAAVLWIDAALWVLAIPALFTLPALWDLISDRRAGLALGAERIAWHAGRRSGEVALAQIETVRFDTRLDLSVRVTLVLRSGRRIRLPQECLPRPAELQSALAARGVSTERHHFSLF
ncbi:hypothetical protein [Rhodosalinus sp. FB01]|uniref:hypothetical protein n=1 Tax=Rhodosalinus sp. FB01 TaxID=3239194 RepID=UPI00352688CA